MDLNKKTRASRINGKKHGAVNKENGIAAGRAISERGKLTRSYSKFLENRAMTNDVINDLVGYSGYRE